MRSGGWKRMLADADWCRGHARFPIAAYSEFMPPPWVGVKPYGGHDPALFSPQDNWGWNVNEYQQAYELRPGMEVVAREILKEVTRLGQGLPTPQISKRKLRD